VLLNRDEPVIPVEFIEVPDRMHVEHVAPARLDKPPDSGIRVPVTAAAGRGEYGINFMPVCMPPAPGKRDRLPLKEGCKDPVRAGISCRFVVIDPECVCDRKFCRYELFDHNTGAVPDNVPCGSC